MKSKKPTRKALAASAAFQAPAPAGSQSDLCADCSSRMNRRSSGSPLYRFESYCAATARYCADERTDPAGKCGIHRRLLALRSQP